MSARPAHPRSIRSYVKRDSRITDAQRKAIELHWPQYGIDYSAQALDLDSEFQRHAPRVLDIGSGMGDSTLALAQQNPGFDYLAVEVHLPGVGSLIRKAKQGSIDNIRLINHDIQDVLSHQLTDNSIDFICIFFPDPWHKKRHHKRRLVSPALFAKCLRVLSRHGRIYIATDWQDYAEQIIASSQQLPGLINLAGDSRYAPRPHWRPLTKFEKRGLSLQHGVWDMVFAKSFSTRVADDKDTGGLKGVSG